MKLKLKVLDPKQKKLTIKDLVEKKIPVVDLDDRWNIEIEFEVPERIILQLVDELIDKIMDNNQLYYYESSDKKSSSLKRDIHINEANSMIQSARAWKKIHVMISDLGYQTSRFTRISLFEILLNIPEMKNRMNNRIHDMEQKISAPKIPQEKIESQLEPEQNITPKITNSNIMEFVGKF